MLKKLIILSFFIFLGSNSNAPDRYLNFDIILHNKVVGNLESTQITKDGITNYQSSTNIKTRLLKDILVNYRYDVVFDNKFLKKADVYITVNKKSHAKTHTQWMGPYYQITKNDDKKKNMKDSITFATIQLYFEEPVDIDNCYSEQDGSFNTIAPLGNHIYKKVNSKRKENMYYYKNGILKKATIDGGLISFEMIARE